jgi:hypothetical protein
MLLQRYHRQRQLLLAHQRQLGAWRQLPTHDSKFAVGLSVPSLGALLAGPEAASASIDGATAVQAGVNAGQQGGGCNAEVQQQQQQQQQQRGSGALSGLRTAIKAVTRRHHREEQQQQPGGAAASAASMQQPPHQAAAASGYSVSVQLLLPHWIPSSLDEQDRELLAADQQRHQRQQQQPDGMPSAAAGEANAEADEAEEGGVLAEVLDEAVDLMATLWEAAE